MAPVPEAYFPSLDKCFSGDVQLLYALPSSRLLVWYDTDLQQVLEKGIPLCQ
jgi:hypothetical protein